MRFLTTQWVSRLVALLGLGCGSSDADMGSEAAAVSDSEATTNEPTAGAQSSAPSGRDWQTLLMGEWTLPPATEDYACVRHTVTEDLYIAAFEAINPPGTHHTFLSVGQPGPPDGVTPCTFMENQSRSIFGSGVGTNPIEFPEGVVMKISAGSQILLNLHLFNSTTSELSGTSGTRMLAIDESEVEYEGENLPAGTLSLELPPQQESSQSGSCMMLSDTTIFAILPHMHELGIHMKVTARSSIDGKRVIHDSPYNFEEQLYYPIDPVRMAEGDEVEYECMWLNNTERTVNFGDSTLDEMCFVGLYRYPADGGRFCVSR